VELRGTSSPVTSCTVASPTSPAFVVIPEPRRTTPGAPCRHVGVDPHERGLVVEGDAARPQVRLVGRSQVDRIGDCEATQCRPRHPDSVCDLAAQIPCRAGELPNVGHGRRYERDLADQSSCSNSTGQNRHRRQGVNVHRRAIRKALVESAVYERASVGCATALRTRR
jgi:hypothetical protein